MRFNEFYRIILEDQIQPRGNNYIGPNIGKIQQGLKSLGYDVGAVDSNYGKQTALAVRKFQKDNNLKVDGDAGTDTVALMNKLLSGKGEVPIDKTLTPSEELVKVTPIPDPKPIKGTDLPPVKPKAGTGAMFNPTVNTPNTDKQGIFMPVPATSDNITSVFGSRSGSHHGVDLSVPSGTEIKSPISGRIVQAEPDGDCGNALAIVNGNTRHRFCHLSKFNVRVGDHVKQGEVVGWSGGDKGARGSGNSTGAHLHWEKYVNHSPVNPMG
jgi:murein DD-endopeptidase MepM/ murein hydrolase activator NlpD